MAREKFYWNSNTTLVKVKLNIYFYQKGGIQNSNTTLVKVKSVQNRPEAIVTEIFKYNTC